MSIPLLTLLGAGDAVAVVGATVVGAAAARAVAAVAAAARAAAVARAARDSDRGHTHCT